MEMLSTILTEVGGTLNNRPFTHISTDIKDPLPLTPSHLLHDPRTDIRYEIVLEESGMSPNRYHYDSQHHRRIVKVAVPRWNPDLGKQKSNFCEILVDLFSFMEKYEITSAAMSVQKFNDWPYGKLVKAILMSLQSLTQKTSKLKLRKIIFCDTDVQTCSQVVNILSEALGQPSPEDSSITLPRAQKRAQIEIFVGKGEIAKEKVLEKFVLDCLHQADMSKYRTLAFPALGTGVLEMPPVRVARTMMAIIRRFETNHPHTTLSTVRILIHPKDAVIYRVYFKLSERRQLVTPAGNLPQRKILHVYVSDANISEAFVRAMILAEQEGDISSLVFPLRFNDPLAKDYTSYTKSLYQAIERYIQMDRRTPSQLMKVKMCISGKHMVNPVLSILEKLDKDHKIIDDHHRRKEITPLILKVTAMREDMRRVLGELDNPPPSVQEPTVIYSRQDSQNIPDDDRTQTIYIRDIYPNVYETFLFFFGTRIQKNSSEVQMEYQSLENRVKITGHMSNVTAWAQDIQKQLLEVKRDMCVDIYDLPQEVKSKKVPVTRIVAELQKSLNLVLLYIPEDCSDSFHIIGLRSTHVESATHKIMDQINLAASRAKQNSTVPMKGSSDQSKAIHPIPMDKRMNVHTFIMPNGMQVYVYQDSILQLPVDCIVNAANEDLDHGGGVARAISDAAGKSMDKECKNYIKKYGKVKVGTSCHTNAGALNYKYIIHTVGPRWKPKEAVSCRRQLRSAVESCISTASDLGMQSVGIPAISSGIFGGPLEECVEIYSEATIQTCLSLGLNTSLKEIHFIDKNPSIVAFISSAFAAAVKNKNTSLPASVEILVNQQTANVTSIRPPSDVESVDVKVKVEYPRKRVFRMEGIEIHEYELKKDFKVLVYSNDIIHCKTSAIAFGQDLKLNHGGLIANTVKKLGGSDYAKKLREAKKGKTLHYGEVLTVDAGNTFETICFYLEAITPTFSQTDLSESCCVSDIQKCNYNLLLEACRIGVPSLAMPFLGTGSDLGKTELMAGVLFHQVVKFVGDIGSDCKLKELHIVNKEQGPTLAIRDLFDEYVTSERRKLAEEWGNALGVSTKTPSLSSHIEGSLIRDVNMSAPMMNGTASEWRSSSQGKFASSEELEEDMEVDGEVGEEEEGTKETSNQPEGKMTVQHKQELHLPGYEQYGTYIVTYDFEDGIQGDDHPNPTVEYEGTMRSGYLPDCPKGELVLQLFKLAFNRKLMFTVGHSRTTGMDNVVTWNDIHHKTSVTGGPQRFGYPDPHYLDRVLEELAAKGVREQDLLDNTE
ncbi:hypothetical protein FSP39_008624 [Pinctada imbricata]|uniref:RING-type E3 ubiquitin transferase n=1 Tax=Pinctada imbricata TaxID=66713 RepID=A0AA88Y5Z8_PINIB|nr:hypothetical protein FSP39_008624 [Pinctada imbricata]